MIMHGTWYKGPQLAHHSHSEYHQFRSYPSFMVAPYHDTCTQLNISAAPNNCLTPNGTAATPILLDNPPFAGAVNHQLLTAAAVTAPPTTHLSSGHLTVLSPTIKIEQSFNEPLSSVEDYALNLECTTVDGTFKKPNNYIWPSTAAHEEHNNNLTGADATSLTLVAPNIPPTPPPDTQIHLDDNTKSVEDLQRTGTTSTSFKSKIINRSSADLGVNSTSNTMPIGGVQGQNPTQGLVHWMSAVMAEHMTGQTHHDPSAVGMHYMWNGNVDQCTQHSKDLAEYNSWPPAPPTTLRNHHMSTKQGYEAKMNDHHNNLQKGHFLEDNRLDHHTVTAQGSILGSSGPVSHHGNHVNHHGSAAAAAALLVVPQPINATKIGSSLGGPGGGGGSATSGGTGRKYQCKMCPQAS